METTELKKAIESLRRGFMSDPNVGQLDPRDVKLVNTSDITCVSFIETNPSVSKALEAIKKHCQWRAKESISDLKANDFPVEVFRLGWIYYSGTDRQGRAVMWTRLKVPLGPKSLLYKYFTFTMEQVRNRTLDTQMKPGVIYDCRDPCIDISALKELVNIGINQYPPWLEYVIFLEMNSTFAFFCKAFRYFFPKQLRDSIRFMSLTELEALISPDNYPDYMAGKIVTLDSHNLKLCPTFSQYAEREKLDKSEIKTTLRYFNDNIDNNNQ